MSATKPELPAGYLGPQSKWPEFGLSTVTHNSPETRCHANNMKIKFKTTIPTKVTAVLKHGTDDDKKFPDMIFTQTLNELVSLDINFPCVGFYKLEVHALLASDKSMSLPNVYNYVIQCTVPPDSKLCGFPKQFAQWKDGCYLFKPFSLKGAEEADIKVFVPGALAVALVIDSEWFTLKQRDPQNEEDKVRPWSCHVEGLSKFKGKAKKASLTANFTAEDDTKYTSLLEYEL